MYLIYTQPHDTYPGIVHLSTDGAVEDCATVPAVLPRERGGIVGDPKAEDLLASRLAGRDYRRCRRCFRYGPHYKRH